MLLLIRWLHGTQRTFPRHMTAGLRMLIHSNQHFDSALVQNAHSRLFYNGKWRMITLRK